uniref:Zinc knuckle domain-containing protein n=1 Tax=Photinus pyralis TaxID=7054 RepID=A0A1Y1MR18_PHOPY
MAVDASNQAGSCQVSTTRPQNIRPKRRGQSSGSQNKTALDSFAREATQTQKSRPSKARTLPLGSGKTTGARASGRRTQPSVRRRRSQWEASSDGETMLPVQTRSAIVEAAKRAPSRCSKCHRVGHRKTSKGCPLRDSESISESEAKSQEQCIVVKL